MYRKFFLILKYILISASLFSCTTTQERQVEEMPVSFITVHHSKLSIPVNATYQWSAGFSQQVSLGKLHNINMWRLLKQSIEQEMQHKGYQKAALAKAANLNISFVAALTSELNDQEIQQQYGLVPGLVTTGVNQQHYEKGTLIFDVVNPDSQQLAWRTAGQALASLDDIPMIERQARIDLFVKKLLVFLPDANE